MNRHIRVLILIFCTAAIVLVVYRLFLVSFFPWPPKGEQYREKQDQGATAKGEDELRGLIAAKSLDSHRYLSIYFNPTQNVEYGHGLGSLGGWFEVIDESGKQLIKRMPFSYIYYWSVKQPNADEFEKSRDKAPDRPSSNFFYYLTKNGKYGYIQVGGSPGCLDTFLFFNADSGQFHRYEFTPYCDPGSLLPGFPYVTESGLALVAEASHSTCLTDGVICEPVITYGYDLTTGKRLVAEQYPRFKSLGCGNCSEEGD